MSLPKGRWFLALVLCFAGSLNAAQGQPPEKTPIKIAAASTETTIDDVIASLGLRVSVEKGGEVRLQDFLDTLHEKHGVNFRVDSTAFKNAEPPLEDVEGQKVKVPRVRNVRLDSLLKLVLEPLTAAFLVRRDHLEITTTKEVLREHGDWRDLIEPEDDLPFVALGRWSRPIPLIHLTMKNRPLEELVHELADLHPDFNILMAPQCGKRAATPIPGRLVNVPLDKALDTLADMTGLKVIGLRNLSLLTSREHANLLLRDIAVRLETRATSRRMEQSGIPASTSHVEALMFPPPAPQERGNGRRSAKCDDYSRRIRERQPSGDDEK